MQSTKERKRNVSNALRFEKFTIRWRWFSLTNFIVEWISFFLQEGTSPELIIKFARETLEITSWTARLYYNSFGSLLATGMNVHLKDNGFLRSVFGLDDREIDQDLPTKNNRFERVRFSRWLMLIIVFFSLFSKWQIKPRLNCALRHWKKREPTRWYGINNKTIRFSSFDFVNFVSDWRQAKPNKKRWSPKKIYWEKERKSQIYFLKASIFLLSIIFV